MMFPTCRYMHVRAWSCTWRSGSWGWSAAWTFQVVIIIVMPCWHHPCESWSPPVWRYNHHPCGSYGHHPCDVIITTLVTLCSPPLWKLWSPPVWRCVHQILKSVLRVRVQRLLHLNCQRSIAFSDRGVSFMWDLLSRIELCCVDLSLLSWWDVNRTSPWGFLQGVVGV